MVDGPLKGGAAPADVKALYDATNKLADRILSAEKAIAAGQSGTVTSPLQTILPCNPFIVFRRARRRGERDTMCFQFPPGQTYKAIKVTVWMYNKAGTAFEEKFTYTFKDFTDAELGIGSFSDEFRPLPFLRTFALTRIRGTNEDGSFVKWPQADPSPNNPPPVSYASVIFTTGAPGLNGTKAHNKFRNGRHERSKYNYKNLVTVPPVKEQLEDFGWFVNCDRNQPITAVGTPAHPNPSNDPLWSKSDGTLRWSSSVKGISQRLPQRILRASDFVDILCWISRTFAITPINATMRVSIVNAVDLRGSGGALTLTTLAFKDIPNVGTGGTFSLKGFTEEQDGAATLAAGNAPLAIIDPTGDPEEVEVGASKPLNVVLQMPSTYTLAQTPSPDDGNSSGQWIRFDLIGVTGSGQFILDRFVCGDGEGDYTPHPDELGDRDSIGDVEVTGGGPRGFGLSYGQNDTSVTPGAGVILRPNTG